MDSLDQILGMVASLAAIFGVVMTFLQYRVKHPSGPVPSDQPAPEAREGPPPVVRAAAVWVVVESVITVLLLYGVFTTVVSDINSFGFTVPTLPESVFTLGPLGLAVLVAIVSVPVAIRRSTGLRDGDASVRGKLLGSAAKDLFFGVALAIAAQVLADDMPESVFGILTVYLTWSIVSALVHITLLLQSQTRAWVELGRTRHVPGGRVR